MFGCGTWDLIYLAVKYIFILITVFFFTLILVMLLEVIVCLCEEVNMMFGERCLFLCGKSSVSQWYSESRTRWMLLVRITGVGRTTNSVAGYLVESFWVFFQYHHYIFSVESTNTLIHSANRILSYHFNFINYPLITPKWKYIVLANKNNMIEYFILSKWHYLVLA